MGVFFYQLKRKYTIIALLALSSFVNFPDIIQLIRRYFWNNAEIYF